MATIYDVAPEPDDIEEPIASPSILDKPPAAVLATPMPQPENPMQAYVLAFDAPRDKPLIAIVIDDMGLDRVRSQRALEMAGPLTLSFLTYATNLTTELTDEEVALRLSAALDPWIGYVGVNNHMGSRFTADPAKMDIVMRAMK